MNAFTYGVIANGKALPNVTITSFADWEDVAAQKLAEMRAEKKLPLSPFHRSRLQQRIAEQGATEVRLFPVG